MFATI